MKKLLALVIAAAMVLALVPMTAMALPEAGLVEIDPPKKVEPTESAWGGFTRPTVDYSYALEFKAKDTYVDDSNPYKDWAADFRIQINHDVKASQIRLAGNYGSFGWVEIKPEDVLGDVTIPGGVEYPVIGSFLPGVLGIPYSEVVNSVKTFQCAFYVDPSVFEEYPDFMVSLDLVMIDPDDPTATPQVIGETQHWPKPDPTPTPEVTPIPEAAPIPETGDGMGLFVFAGLALISVLGMVVLKKREQF